MPEQNTPIKTRRATTDDNLIEFVKNIARTYGKMGLLSRRLTTQAVAMTNNVDAVNRVISRVGQLDPESKKVFGNYFVGEDLENLEMATRAPEFLAAAYQYISEHRNDSDEMRDRFDRIGAHVDELSANFANSGGMVVNNSEWPLVDTNNIADAYEGLSHVFAARRADIEQMGGDPAKITEFDRNLNQLNTVVENYDQNWGVSHVDPDHAGKLDDRWSDLWDALNRAELSPELKENLHKWGFTDAKGNEIPQFKQNGTLDKSGRLAAIIDLARHDVAKQHVARVNEKIDEEALAKELNEAIEFKLYNMAVADKAATAAKVAEMRAQDPGYEPDFEPEIDINRLNSDPDYRAYVINELQQDGATVSDTGYNAQLDADVNATAGWVARIKSKLGGGAENVGGFFDRVFHPISRVDRLANVRMTGNLVDKRSKRIEFMKRILKGFASAFVASAIITTVATAAAATAGISLAVSMAAIGMITAIGMGVIQVSRWRREQQKAGKPTDIHAFLADKRLVTSLGVSAIAVIAMCFGAAGMANAAVTLGYGAMVLGGGKNAVETFRDARRTSKMSIAEALAWAIANAGAVIAGGLTGRMTANAAIDAYNARNPENTLLQNKNTHTETREITDTRDVTEMRHELTPEAEAYAKRTVESWYRDNPDLLQQRIDGINEYNAAHGTDYNPYRVLLANGHAGGLTADNNLLHVENSHLDPNINDVHSHGIHKSMSDAWGAPRGISHQTISDAGRGLFNPDGSVTETGMEAISKVEPYIYEHGQIGPVQGIGNPSSADHVFHDKYFPDNDPRGWTTYGDGKPAYVDNEYTYPETFTRTESFDVTDYSRAHGDGMAMFGNYNRRAHSTPRDRIGSSDQYPFIPLNPDDRRRAPRPQDQDTDFVIDEGDDNDENIDQNGGNIDQNGTNGYLPVIYDKPGMPDRRNLGNDDGGLVPSGTNLPARRTSDGRGGLVVTHHGTNLPVDTRTGGGDLVPTDRTVTKDLILAIEERSDAKNWLDWQENLKDAKDNLSKEKSESKKKQYQRQIKDWQRLLNELWNKLGRYSKHDLDIAAKQRLKRERLENLKSELLDLAARKPSDQDGKVAMMDWKFAVDKIQNEIEKLYKDLGAAAFKENLFYPMPVEGRYQKMKRNKTAQYPIEPAPRETAHHETVTVDNADDQVEPEYDDKPIDISRAVVRRESFKTDSHLAPIDRYLDGGYRLDFDINNHSMPKLDLSRLKKSKSDNISDAEIRKTGATRHSDEVVADQGFLPDLSNPNPMTNQKPEHTSPVTSVGERPKHNERGGLVGMLRRAYDYLKRSNREREYFVPRSLENLAMNNNITERPLTKIGDTPVYLVDLTGNNTPITQNEDRAIVVVDVKGLRIPFYLTNGTEYNGKKPGRWQPLTEIYKNGKWIALMFNNNAVDDIDGLDAIARALDTQLGDIRNYRDMVRTADYNELGGAGFVGGADAVPHVEPATVFDLIHKAEYGSDKMVFGTYDDAKRISAYPQGLGEFLQKLKSNDSNDKGRIRKFFDRFSRGDGM